ncbi:MAG: hypothetical protein ACE5GE_02590 [Phycisphaerae bacterium]
MEALRQLLHGLGRQLGMMSRSQQMVVVLCGVIVAGSLLWLTQWSARPRLVPLLDQPMTAEEMSAAVAQLQAMRTDFEEVGDRIFVKPGERRRLQRELLTRGGLPQDTSLGFENLLKDQSPFQPESINRRNFQIALQNELAAVIAEDPTVSRATVFINASSQRKLGARSNLVPTASVDVSTSSGASMGHGQVMGMANLVSGAVAGLSPHNVRVIVNGRPRTIPGPEDDIGFGLLEQKKKNEKHLEDKIRDQLAYIPGVKVAVSVELETTRKRTQLTDYTDPEPKTDTTKTEETNSGSAGSEAGVSPNTGTALTGSAGGASTSKEESSTEFFKRDVTRVETMEQVPMVVKRAMASINIPRSYFVSVFSAQDSEASSPSDDDLKVLIDIEKLRVKAAVKRVLQTDDEDAVQVDWFPDLAPEHPGQFAESPIYAAGGGEEAEGTVATLTGYAPTVGMVGLAVGSLLMMFMLVRKSGRSIDMLPPELEAPADPDEVQTMDAALLSEGALVGQEVDEQTLRFQNYTEQVAKMVDEDPDTAAELLQRWAEQD